MNNNILELYPHNILTYKKVSKALKNENIVGIEHATGIGKTYIGLNICYDNKDKKILYITPSNSIIEHIYEIIESNSNLDLKKDFSHVEFRTYQSFVNMTKDEITNLNVDMLILDEFHHLGAPIWGARIEDIINTHPNIKVFGMTAYTIREKGTINERNMSNPNGEELFSNKIVSKYDLCDAIIDGVLPKPIYKSAYIKLETTSKKLEEKIEKLNKDSKDYKECKKILDSTKKQIHKSPEIKELVKKTIKPNGKYIYFCPPNYEEGINYIDNIMEETKSWFLEMGLKEEDIVFYKTTSNMEEEGKKNRDAFYNDLDLFGNLSDEKLRIMFAINQYNEGVHAPNLDGVIMGRTTSSDIVYFEQLGRALSVKGNTKERIDELEKKELEELISICKKRDIPIKENDSKEDIIEKIIAPTIIDLTNNYEFIKELENNLKERIKEKITKTSKNKNKIKLENYKFDIEILNQDLYETLRYVMDRVTITWEDRYKLAESYYLKYKHLNIPSDFKTINGYEYDENGINIGHWLRNQRISYHNDRLSKDKIDLLNKIEMDFTEPTHDKWNIMYNLAKKYYEYHKNLKVPSRFKTLNGYERNKEGLDLGRWIRLQMRNYKIGILKKNRIKLLEKLDINFQSNYNELEWNKMYNLASIYYEHHKDLEIPASFKTLDGYTRDEKGFNLGTWIFNQRKKYENLSKEKKKLLDDLNIRLNTIDYEEDWNYKYNLASNYYKHHKNLLIPNLFKTTNGFEYAPNGISLGRWLMNQKTKFNKLPKEKQDKLLKIGFVINAREEEWLNMYKLACNFYKDKNHLVIPHSFKTINGIIYDRNGVSLGVWIASQRRNFTNLSKEKQNMLLGIGFIINVKPNREKIEEICSNNNINFSLNKDILIKTSYQEFTSKINYLKENNIKIVNDKGILHDIFSMASPNMKVLFGYTLEEMITKYNKKNKEKGV